MTCVLIDCDPGLDDAVALLAAFGAKELEILVITSVAGNVKGDLSAINACIIREVADPGSRVPGCAGAPRPLLRDPVTAEDFHGSTGLGNIDFPEPRLGQEQTHAVNKIIRACKDAREDPLTLIVTGPMTNIALALAMDPEIEDGIAEIVLMGGADREGGNITPYAEFNIYADPHAAAAVFGSGLAIRCLSLDVTHEIRTTAARLDDVRSGKTRQSRVAGDLLEASCKLEFSANGAREAPLHDPSTVIAVTDPELFQGRRASVEVVTDDGEQFGRTIPTFCEDGNVLWYESADSEGVFDALVRHLETAR